MAAALAIAQLVGFFLLVNERQRASLLENVGPAIARFADMAQEMDALDPAARQARLASMRRFDRRYALADQSAVTRFALPRDAGLEQRIARALSRAGTPLTVEAANAAPPMRFMMVRPNRGPGARRDPEGPPDVMIMGPPPLGPDAAADASPRRLRLDAYTFSVRLSDGQWMNAVYRMPRPSRDFLWRLAATAAILYAIVLSAALLVAHRLSRPFRILTQAAETVGAETFAPLPARGPADVRAAIEAFNAMALRVSALLQEKDTMLGAIGHDLRTPLASLRIRAESMEPAAERERVVETLDDMGRILEDILELARLGRSSEPKRLLDLSALADTVVEEFRALGGEVAFRESPRAPVQCQRSLTARLIRNLIENAVKFAGAAEVSVTRDATGLVLSVEDDGPGVPDEALARVSEAFVRVEGSRNRETGGAGLGLAIAKAIAASQGATLELANRAEGGFAARVRWPAG
ncbi:MAG: ATP-binding protein [Hyphomonadaceae bacterium]